MNVPIRIGVSSCLLGESVRYDGGHKRDSYVVDVLGKFVELHGVCPEYELGLGVPREPIRIEGTPANPRLMSSHTRQDLTQKMQNWCDKRVKQLAREKLCGYVFKSKSPSCGTKAVKLFDARGVASPKGVGLFANTFVQHFTNVPIEEEEQLHDAGSRALFVERLFATHRLLELWHSRHSIGSLLEFHSRHKLQLMAHSPKHYRELGHLLGQAKQLGTVDSYQQYRRGFCAAMAIASSHRKQRNVLEHIMGYFKKDLTATDKQELLQAIEEYYQARTPLLLPLTLLRHYARKFEKDYLLQQSYLYPHPAELILRNLG